MSLSEKETYYLGLDIGSVAFSYVLMDRRKQILKSDYLMHQGNISVWLKEILESLVIYMCAIMILSTNN